jgi:hypothetical protein
MMIRHRRFLACVSVALLAWTIGASWIGHTCRIDCSTCSRCSHSGHHSTTLTAAENPTLVHKGFCPACLLTRHLQTTDTAAWVDDSRLLVVHPLRFFHGNSLEFAWTIAVRTRGPPAS